MAAVPSIGRASLVEAPRRAPQVAATEGLYERHSAKILAYCRHQLGSREEAEDAVQTTFMNAFRALGRGVVPEAETAWLFKIAENVCLSRRRSSWRRGRIESPSDFEVIEEIVPGPSRQRDELIGIEDALASMPEQQRRAILLREWQGLSYREIAEELEVSQSAVETLIFRARRSLAQGLEQPETLKPQTGKQRKSFRRALHALDLGTLLAALKTVLAGSAAVKATAAAVAVTAAAGTVATVGPELESKRRSAKPAAPAPAVVPGVAVEQATAVEAGRTTIVSSAPTLGVVESSSKRAPKVPAAAKEQPSGAAAPPHTAPSEPAQAAAAAPPAPAPAAPTAAATPSPESAGPETPVHAQPDRGNDEGKKADEGKRPEEGKREEQSASVDVRQNGTGKGRDKEEAPAAESPAPAAVTAPVSIAAPQAEDSNGKSDRGRERDKEKAKQSEPAPVVEAAPLPIQETPAQTAAASGQGDANTHGGGSDNGKAKGKDKDK